MGSGLQAGSLEAAAAAAAASAAGRAAAAAPLVLPLVLGGIWTVPAPVPRLAALETGVTTYQA